MCFQTGWGRSRSRWAHTLLKPRTTCFHGATDAVRSFYSSTFPYKFTSQHTHSIIVRHTFYCACTICWTFQMFSRCLQVIGRELLWRNSTSICALCMYSHLYSVSVWAKQDDLSALSSPSLSLTVSRLLRLHHIHHRLWFLLQLWDGSSIRLESQSFALHFFQFGTFLSSYFLLTRCMKRDPAVCCAVLFFPLMLSPCARWRCLLSLQHVQTQCMSPRHCRMTEASRICASNAFTCSGMWWYVSHPARRWKMSLCWLMDQCFHHL